MPDSPTRISIVDDEACVRTALRRLFCSAGFQVETFASGLEFLDSLDKQPADCVVLDMNLPNFSGLEVQQRLTQANRQLPIVMITGRDEPGVAHRVMAAGAFAYLTKPLSEQTLLEAIAAATHAAPPKSNGASTKTAQTVKEPTPIKEHDDEHLSTN